MAGKTEIEALVEALGEEPRRDNAAYLAAMAQARRAFAEAEQALGGPVTLKSKARLKKKKGRYSVKWTFSRAQ